MEKLKAGYTMQVRTKYDILVKLTSKACLSLVGLFSLLGLLFWILDQVVIGGWGGISIPMAPITAIFNILFVFGQPLSNFLCL